MKKLYQELKGSKRHGVLLTKYQLEDATLIRGAAIVVSGKQRFSITHANDKGWHDKEGNVYKFHHSGNRLYIRNVVFALSIFSKKTK